MRLLTYLVVSATFVSVAIAVPQQASASAQTGDTIAAPRLEASAGPLRTQVASTESVSKPALAPAVLPAGQVADCAGGTIGTSFAAAPITDSLSTTSEVDCFEFSAVAGDVVNVVMNSSTGSPRVQIASSTTVVCSSTSSTSLCTLYGAGPYQVQVSAVGAAGFTYSLAVRRVTNPQGCTSLGDPSVWSFAAPRLNGSVSGALRATCYTFNRDQAEADGAYWFRTVRVSGTLSPSLRVYNPAGGQECSGSSSDYQRCLLQEPGQHVLVVEDSSRTSTGSYYLTAKRTTDPQGCTTLPSIAFGAAPISATISTAGEIDCHTIPNVSTGDVVYAVDSSTGGLAQWRILDGRGVEQCASIWSNNLCTLNGTGPWTVIAYNSTTEAPAYTLAVRRVTNPQGCSSLGDPGVWSFAAPRLNGSVPGALGGTCYTFNRDQAEPDGAYWFRAVRVSGTLSPSLRVYNPAGEQECSGYSGDYQRCLLQAPGQHLLVVEDSSRTATGSYYLTAKRTTDPQGCTTLPSIAFGATPISATISTAGEIDCHTIPNVSTGDVVYAVDSSTGGLAQWRILDGRGVEQCASIWSGNLCTLNGTGPWTVIAYNSTTEAPAYTLAVRRVTNPQGCSSLGDPGVWSFAAPRLNGSVPGALGGTCYTFNRDQAEPDGAYWFRAVRVSGTLSPSLRVYNPAGEQECSGYSGDYQRCLLQAPGQHLLVVEDSSRTATGSYYLTAKRTTDPQGCTPLPSIAFGATPISATISTAGEIDCHTIPNVSTGDVVNLVDSSTSGQGQWRVLDGRGAEQCASIWSGNLCTLNGTGPWTVIAYNSTTEAPAYTLAVRRVTNPQGCSPLGDPAAWSFTAPRINGSVSGALRATCYTFNRDQAEADGAYWFRTVRVSGTLSPSLRVYNPAGGQECSGSSSDYQRCLLQEPGQHVLVVEDSSRTSTGTYYLTAKRTTDPQGCTTLPSVAFGLPAVAGNVSTVGEIDCYRLQGFAGDDLTIHASGVADRLAVVDATGVNRCTGGAEFGCTLSGAGPFSILVYPYDAAQTGSYSFSVACNNIPCGQSDTTVTDVTPSRIGAGRVATLLLRGKDLQLLQSAKLTRSGATVTGAAEEAAEDGRARGVRFDMASAAVGAWNLEVAFLDGTTRTVPSAVTVEAVRPPVITAELVGRDVFRVGQPTTVSVVVKNTGNVDGLSTPITISGIPEGATISSLTDLFKPVGPDTNLTTAKATFNQEADTFTKDGVITVPFVVARVPAGGSVRLDLQVVVPQATEYAITASAGKCMAPAGQSGQAGRTAADNPEQDCYAAIVGGVYEIVTDGVPGGGCISYGVDLYSNYMASINGGDSFFSPSNLWGGLWGAIDCATDLYPPSAFAKAGIGIIGSLNTANDLIQDCLLMPESSRLQQRGVASFDPNDITGPAGRGDERFIQGDTPLSYQVYFENLPAATAPAQSVKITNQLDTTKFDPASVLFSEVRFGSTVYQLPYADHSIDHVIDLRPTKNLLVRATANVTTAGLITWELQSLDPETLAPPEDPLAGFLPPNHTAPEGEGRVAYSVRLKSLPSATVVTNKASIVFDTNPAIETPIWSNKLDKLPPSATVSVAGQSNPRLATVTWTGSDDAAGVVLYELRVAKDGGAFGLWHTSTTPGSATFQAPTSGSYSFVVVAHDGASNTAQSTQAAISLVGEAPPEAGTYASLAPSRVLDTRSAIGAAAGPVAARGVVHLSVLGRGGVPASGVSAVVLNVTVTQPTTAGYVTVFPDGTTMPTASNLNFAARQTIPNLVVARVGANGKIALANNSTGTAHLTADVAGYYLAGTPTAAGTFASLAPSRVLDTRSAIGAAAGPVAARGVVHLSVLGRGGVPASGVSAVVLNATVTQPTTGGYITVYPDGTTMPTASNLNFVARQTIPNLVVARVGANGKIALANNSTGTAHLTADIAGYYLAGTPTVAGAFVSLAPSRSLDTRSAIGTAIGPVPARGVVPLSVLARNGVPASGVSAVVLNTTVTQPTTGGYITVYPDGTTMPTASNLNFVARQTIPNLVVARVGANGKVALANNSTGTAHLTADIAGYYLAGSATS
ncbi:hypothetical protein [Kribbella endophytica]